MIPGDGGDKVDVELGEPSGLSLLGWSLGVFSPLAAPLSEGGVAAFVVAS